MTAIEPPLHSPHSPTYKFDLSSISAKRTFYGDSTQFGPPQKWTGQIGIEGLTHIGLNWSACIIQMDQSDWRRRRPSRSNDIIEYYYAAIIVLVRYF